jgi:hypothetical protein
VRSSARLVAAAALAFGGAGCFIPPDLSPESGDAGPSGTPIIVEGGPAPDFSFPGPIQLDHGDARRISLILRDPDVDDVLYVRLYVDYVKPPLEVPTPPWADCQAAPTDSALRIAECPTSALCTSIDAADQGNHVLEAMVSDRPFIPDSDPAAFGQPTYRAVDDVSQAASSAKSWVMVCRAPSDL